MIKILDYIQDIDIDDNEHIETLICVMEDCREPGMFVSMARSVNSS
jgi:hypothetical protein